MLRMSLEQSNKDEALTDFHVHGGGAFSHYLGAHKTTLENANKFSTKPFINCGCEHISEMLQNMGRTKLLRGRKSLVKLSLAS